VSFGSGFLPYLVTLLSDVCFGDDIICGEPGLLKFNESVELPSVLNEFELSGISEVSNRLDEKFGNPQFVQYQEKSDSTMQFFYMSDGMYSHLMWNHVSHLSHKTASSIFFTDFLHWPQVYFGVLGPGLGSG